MYAVLIRIAMKYLSFMGCTCININICEESIYLSFSWTSVIVINIEKFSVFGERLLFFFGFYYKSFVVWVERDIGF